MGWIQCNALTEETVTPREALSEALSAIYSLDAASNESKEFGRRENAAVLLLIEGARPMAGQVDDSAIGNGTLVVSCGVLLALIMDAHRRIGAPGDFGYDTPEGDALRWLYAATRPLAMIARKYPAPAAAPPTAAPLIETT